MSSSRNTSPARSQSAYLTPRRLKLRTPSVGSPSRANVSERLTSVAEEAKKKQGSFMLSPLTYRKSILTDNTYIDQPGRKSWWQRLGENSRDVIEVLNTNEPIDTNNVIEEYVVLSQEKKNFTLDLPESSDNESINSIVVPQRRLFTEQPTQNKNNFDKIIGTRDTLAKINKTNNDLHNKSVKVTTKNLFNHAPKRTRPAFPEALLTISPNKTIANKTKEVVTAEVKGQVKTLFGNRPATKRKNMFVDFIVSESEDEIPDIQPRVFGFPKKTDGIRRVSSVSRGTRDPSPTSSITTDIEMDDWKQLPSSTMVENEIQEMMMATTTSGKARLSKLSEAKESNNCTNYVNRHIVSVIVHNSENDENEMRIEVDNSQYEEKQNIAGNNEQSIAENNAQGDGDQNMEIENKGDEEKNITENYEHDKDEQSVADNNEHGEDEDSMAEDNEQDGGKQNNLQDGVCQSIEVKNKKCEEKNKIAENNENELSVAENKEHSMAEDNKEGQVEQSSASNNAQDSGSQSIEVENEKNKTTENNEHDEDEQSIAEDNQHNEDEHIMAEDYELGEDKQSIVKNNAQDDDGKSIEVENNEDEEENIAGNNEQGKNEQSTVEDNEHDENEHSMSEEDEQEKGEQNIEVENNEDEEENGFANNNKHDEDEAERSIAINSGQNEEIEQVSIHESENEEQLNESTVEEEDDQTEDNSGTIEQSQEDEENENEEIDESDDDQNEQSILRFDDEQEEETDHDTDHEEGIQESKSKSVSTPNISHDTTGRHRSKEKDHDQSPEAILQNLSEQKDSFWMKGRNTSIRKTKSMIKQLSIKPSLATVRDSAGFSDGTKNSSAEGSGWDSHRTTRKTIRQTMGKDFSPRKSLRALVMEKSAKRYTAISDLNDDHQIRVPQANSTQYPEAMAINEDQENDSTDTGSPVSNHEVSKRTRQATLEMYLQSIKKRNHQKRLQIEEEVKNSLKFSSNENTNYFKLPSKPGFALKHKLNTKSQQTKPKAKSIKTTIIPFEDLPDNLLEDMKYKPPKRYKPGSASWITKRLYNFLESKLEANYDYKARIRAEKLVETIYMFTKDLRRHPVAPKNATDVLKLEMARLNIVKTHFDFYNFFHEYMPREVRVKVVPDLVNKLSIPKHGVFMDILK